VIGLAVVAALVLVALVVALRYPKRLLYVTIALVPWQGLDFEMGLRLTAARVVLGLLCVVCVAALLTHRVPRGSFPVSGATIALALYAVLLTLMRIPFLPEASVAGGSLRGPAARSLVQCVYFLAVFGGGILVAPLYLREEEDFRVAARCFVWSLLVLASLGWLQLALWYGTGWNPFPVGLLTSWGGDPSLRQATFSYGDVQVHRMNSLGGEPKDLGQGLMVGLFLIQAIWIVHPDPALSRRLRGPWILLFVSMLLTLSTSALSVWPVVTVLEVALYRVFVRPAVPRHLRGGIGFRGAIGLAAFMAVVYWATPKDLGQGMRIGDLLAARTVERLELEDFDQAIGSLLIHEPAWIPFGVGLGNAHLYADRYLTDATAEYAQGKVFRSKTGTLRVVSELGITGLSLWIVAVWSQLLKLRAALRVASRTQSGHAAVSIGGPLLLGGATLAFSYLLLSATEEAMFLTLGIVVAFTALIQRKLWWEPELAPARLAWNQPSADLGPGLGRDRP
jgi:hypothetical protein